MKTKIQINSIFGELLFEYEKENNTIKDTVLEAIKQNANLSFANLSYANLSSANLRSADLSYANLRSADLRSADLSSADLSFANLRSANLSFANLRSADLRSAKNWQLTEWANQAKQNILCILSYLPTKIQGLKDKIISGKINGTQYSGDCCCLIGTLGDQKACNIIPYYTKGLHNLGEQLFYQIKENDTPNTNEFSKLAVELCDQALLKIK